MTEATVEAGTAKTPNFSVEKIYLKDASLEAPNQTSAFLTRNEDDMEVSLRFTINTQALPSSDYEVILGITVTSADKHGTVFVVEINQCGIFSIQNIKKPERLNRFLNVLCPRILFPYARETISSLVVKAGFPPILISQIDFATTYRQRIESKNGDGMIKNPET